MIVNNIPYSSYYLYNPIWMEVAEFTGNLNLNIEVSGRAFDFTFYPRNGSVIIDLSKIILGIIPEIQNKKSIIYTGINWNVDGAYPAVLRFNNEITLTKTFVIGGVVGQEENVYTGVDLSVSNSKWENVPSFDFKLLPNGQIQGQPITESNRHLRTCDGYPVIFRNQLGGFDTYVFEDFNTETSGRDLGYYNTRANIIPKGIEVEKEVTVRTKLKRSDSEVINHLMASREIYHYDLNRLARIFGSNKHDYNHKNYTEDFAASFLVPINYSQRW